MPLVPGEYNTYYKYEKVGTVATKRHQFIEYNPLTPVWQYASSYSTTYSYSGTVSGSFTYSGYTGEISFEVSNSITATIPANSSKQSKLAYYADYNIVKYKTTFVEQGVTKSVTYTYKGEYIANTASCEVIYR